MASSPSGQRHERDEAQQVELDEAMEGRRRRRRLYFVADLLLLLLFWPRRHPCTLFKRQVCVRLLGTKVIGSTKMAAAAAAVPTTMMITAMIFTMSPFLLFWPIEGSK